MSVQSLEVHHRFSNNDPLNPRGLDYDWPTLSDLDREIFGPEQSEAWELQQRDTNAWVVDRQWAPGFWESMDFFLTTN